MDLRWGACEVHWSTQRISWGGLDPDGPVSRERRGGSLAYSVAYTSRRPAYPLGWCGEQPRGVAHEIRRVASPSQEGGRDSSSFSPHLREVADELRRGASRVRWTPSFVRPSRLHAQWIDDESRLSGYLSRWGGHELSRSAFILRWGAHNTRFSGSRMRPISDEVRLDAARACFEASPWSVGDFETRLFTLQVRRGDYESQRSAYETRWGGCTSRRGARIRDSQPGRRAR